MEEIKVLLTAGLTLTFGIGLDRCWYSCHCSYALASQWNWRWVQWHHWRVDKIEGTFESLLDMTTLPVKLSWMTLGTEMDFLVLLCGHMLTSCQVQSCLVSSHYDVKLGIILSPTVQGSILSLALEFFLWSYLHR
jgi:hypothetical protein